MTSTERGGEVRVVTHSEPWTLTQDIAICFLFSYFTETVEPFNQVIIVQRTKVILTKLQCVVPKPKEKDTFGC